MESCKSFFLTISLIILILSIILYWSFEKSYIEIEITDPSLNAKCLDGSNYKFLFSSGFDSGKNSFYLYFEGGGFCGTENYDPLNTEASLEFCEKRSMTRLGNNEFSFISKNVFKPLSWFLSSSKYWNPNFYNWNKIYIKYCDGTMHMGNLENPINYKGKKLFIRGEQNVKSVIDFLLKEKNFASSENVLVTGSSAGGLAAVFYSKYIKDLINQKTNYKVISDSGYFLRPDYNLKSIDSHPNVLRHMLEILRDNLNLKKTDIMEKYNMCKNSDFIDCIFPNDYLNNIINRDYDVLFLTSSYDSWAMSRLLRTECYFTWKTLQNCTQEEKSMFEKYSNDVIEEIKGVVDGDKNGKTVAWINKGIFHTYLFYSWSWGIKKYGVEGYSLDKFVNDWYNGLLPRDKKIYYDGIVKEKLVDFFWTLCFFDTDF